MSSKSGMVQWKGLAKSSKRSSSPARSSSPSRSSTPKTASARDIYIKASPQGGRASPRSASPRGSQSRGGVFTPRTNADLRRREAKSERRRLQAEAKAHKLSMWTQKQDYRHQKRTQNLEYSRQFKETYGASKTTIIAGGVGIAALLGYMFFS
ncbi:hypothetical protein ATCVNEJV2_287R [Acanthocystis turfacea Chlorella virus NE-JV-2]|nr:hypothetical protein ATCVNEJV2_287R [Acanthocystis turfacea Chlorella virus NE-JV-2]